MSPANPIHGSLLGTALGDSLGLPSEGMSRRRIARRWPGPLGQRLVLGRGMVSDDTEHAFFTASALARCEGSSALLQKLLARRLRWWLLCLPAGVGLATARAIFKLWLGIPPAKAGVASAGNGPVMRAPLLGACFPRDESKRRDFVTACTHLTHTDPRALQAALMAAEAAAFAARGEAEIEPLLNSFDALGQHEVWKPLLRSLRDSLGRSDSVADYAAAIGCRDGVSGYAPLSTAVALYAWLRHRHDFPRIISEAVACGGDTDTVAAIAGGIAGAEAQGVSFPNEWVDRLADRPLSTSRIKLMVEALAENLKGNPVATPDPALVLFLPRNLLFLLIVLAHGFRRLLPPY